jgi:hypothetical protein
MKMIKSLRFALAACAALAMLFIGCKNGGSSSPLPTGYSISNASATNLETKFGTTTVTDTFKAIDAYINHKISGHTEFTYQSTDTSNSAIHLGDYIDLDSISDGTTTVKKSDTANDDNSTPLTRLIVVGINSFNRAGDGTSASTKNTDHTPHIVMQFENVAFTHVMKTLGGNSGGYAAMTGTGDMCTYLTGDFLSGLETATGLTDAMLFAPKQYTANGSGATNFASYTDTVWLPTAWEMFGENTTQDDSTYETTDNQSWLEYYTSDTNRIKYSSNTQHTYDDYWTASPNKSTSSKFVLVSSSGQASNGNLNYAYGCVPAFCVK